MFKVYCEDGTRSIDLEDLNDAKEWAHESGQWFEIVRLEDCEIVYTAEDYEFSTYYYDPADRQRDYDAFDEGKEMAKEGF
jgi:hypothetical protein